METIKNMNWKLWALVLLIGTVATVVPGCVRDWIKVNPPQAVVDRGVPSTISLNESQRRLPEYRAEQQLILDSWAARENIAESKAQFWEGAVGGALTPETLTLMGLNPVGGAGAIALFLGGIMIKRPGDVQGKEKIASYNKGKEASEKLIDLAYANGRTDKEDETKRENT